WKDAWELTTKGLTVVLLAVMMSRLGWPRLRFVFYALCLLFLIERHDLLVGHYADSVHHFVLLLLGILALSCNRVPWRACLGIMVILALLSLVKFSLLVLALGVMAALVAALLLEGRWLTALSLPSAYLASGAAIWLLAGQALSNAPRYLAGSWKIANGYSEGMALDGGLDG